MAKENLWPQTKHVLLRHVIAVTILSGTQEYTGEVRSWPRLSLYLNNGHCVVVEGNDVHKKDFDFTACPKGIAQVVRKFLDIIQHAKIQEEIFNKHREKERQQQENQFSQFNCGKSIRVKIS